MTQLAADLRYACRTLLRSPGFTLVALATLALSLGANTAIFSFVNAVLLKPLPYDQPERIVRVLEAPPGGWRNGISTLNFLDWQKQNKVFDFMAADTGGSASLTGVDDPVEIPGARVSAHYFDIFGITRPSAGRLSRARTRRVRNMSLSSATPCGKRGSAAMPRSSAAPSSSTARRTR
jgi:putative ABC transport system permease protein